MPTKKSAPLGSDSSPTRKTTRTARADTKPSTTAALATSATKEPAPVDEPTSDSLGRKATARIDAGPDLGWLLGLFKPSRLEQRVLTQLFASSGAVTVSQLASTLGISTGQLSFTLAPQGLLRGAALVEVEASAELGYPHPEERLVLGRGLLVAQHDRETLPTQLPGLSALPTPEPDAAWAAALVTDRPAQLVLDLLKERLVSIRPLLLLLSGCSGEITSLLAQAVRLRLSRPVFYVDGAALAGWPQPDLVSALRRLRRDADVRGAALVVQDVEHLGAAWRALTQPKPSGQTAPIILCSSGSLSQPRHFSGGTYGNPLQLMAHSLRPTSTQSIAASSPADHAESEPPDVDRSREEARRQAAVDAARAMGRPIPKEFQSVEPAAPVAKPGASVVTQAAPIAPAKPTPATAPPKVESAPQAETPTAHAAPRPVNPRLAAALAKAGLPPAGHATYRGEANTAAAPAAIPAPSPSSATAPASAPATTGQATAPPASVPPTSAPSAMPAGGSEGTPTAAPPGEDLAEGPPLPLGDEAKLEEVIGVAKSTTNNNQRSQILRRLAGTKSPHVIQLFRLFTNHPHPGVRSAAEAGMESIFGSNWNRARTIAPPTQPPRSDDGGRGPGGAL